MATAVSGNVYSSKQFELFICDQTTMGTAMTTSANDSFVKLDVTSMSDIDYGGGLVQDRTLRSGQQIKKSTDHYVSQKGSSASFQFEWVVSHKQGLDLLLKLATEDSASDYQRVGSATSAVYNHGATTGEYATVIISNPLVSDDRVMHSAVLTDLSLSLGSDSGGRLVASGTFYSGYLVSRETNAVAPNGTETAYVKTIYDMDVKQMNVKGATGSGVLDVVCSSFSFNINHPAVRVGYQGANDEAEQYSMSGEYVASGSITVKYDENTEQELAGFLNGRTNAITFGDDASGGSPTLLFVLPAVVYTGYNVDLGDNEAGAFVEVPFECTADGDAKAHQIYIA